MSKSYEGWTDQEIEKHRAYNRAYKAKIRKENPEKIKQEKKIWRKAWRKKNKEKIRAKERDFKRKCVEYKGCKCQKCGLIDDPCVYDFHHRDSREKDFSISRMKNFLEITPTVKKEIDKCDLLCANCHRKVHKEIKEREKPQKTGA